MQTYLDFNQYIRQGEPAQKDRAEAWRVAIGLQAVDGLKTSEYLLQTARRNIEGDITIDEARELLKQYYISKTTHNSGDADNEEADKVSVNITKILSSGTFDFSANGIISLHRRILTEYSNTPGGFATMTSRRKNGCWKARPSAT